MGNKVGKKKFAFLIFIILMIITGLLVAFKDRTELYITQTNKHLNMGEFKLIANEIDLKDILKQNFIRQPGFGITSYSNEKDGIKIEFTGRPDIAKGIYALTCIETTNPGYSVYDIHVGGDVDKAIKVLKKNGFRKSGTDTSIYRKGKIVVHIYINSNKIDKISVGLIRYETDIVY